MKKVHAGYLAFIAAALLLSACDGFPESFKSPNMTALPPRLQPMFEKTKVICFGRFQVEVPDSATIVYARAQTPFNTERLEGAGENLAQWVAKEEAKFRSTFQFPSSDGVTNYKETIDGAVPGQKIVIGYQDGSMLANIYQITSFVKVGADLFVQSTSAGVEPNEPGSDWTLPKKLAGLDATAGLLRARPNDEVPTEPGVCIDGGFIADAPGLSHEKIPLGVRFKEFPDVHLSIEVTKTPRIDDAHGVERRLKKAEANAQKTGMGDWYSRIKFFRRGERQIEGWKGYEVLARKPAQEGASENHQFLFESQGEPDDALKPMLDVNMDTGVKGNAAAGQKPSLEDDEAVALWDKLTSSIRVRPVGGAAPKKTSDAGSLLPLGELAATGRACPQTGMWECVDEGDIRGGRRQLFRAGEKMPAIVRVGAPSLWQRIKGETPTYRSATVWKLVDHDVPRPS
ncbi:hypothetical protein CLU95_4377 [Variovorax sp. 54]|uniref:T6SS immunity protein Tli4 family protein n=1 Tax=Variovorax sp. 54 TaxID=2035212 RepID=UPI000C5208FA|nr:T6SS immunity protein Tli4 family protein [Variovorax sp. 54]PIF77204.1 hypothetical protein CLU95_4377 [Variovorax sp. 54]